MAKVKRHGERMQREAAKGRRAGGRPGGGGGGVTYGVGGRRSLVSAGASGCDFSACARRAATVVSPRPRQAPP